MNSNPSDLTSRRQFIKTTGQVAAVSALAGAAIPSAHAAGSDMIQVALVGCGGRGSGAAQQALSTKSGPIKLVAMADAYENRLKSSYANLSKQLPKQVDVPEDRRFVGFDAYQKAMDCLKSGDVAIFATPLAFRWVHFGYAIQKGLNVFMEKPLTADGPTSKRMFALAEAADAKNLKCGVGLMSRHARHLQELAKRVQDGELGEIILMRGYRMAGQLLGHFASLPKPANMTDLDYQVQRFHSMLWAGGGCYSDFNIHIIDHLSWIKGSWPVKVQTLGGRHYQRTKEGVPYIDQNFDSYASEYTFADGTKMLFDGRVMVGSQNMYYSAVHGAKGLAIASRSGDCGTPASIYKGQAEARADRLWQSTDTSNPYQNEWDELVEAIRNNKPYNEVKRGVEASLVTSMGRASAHIGQEVTFEQMLNSDHEFAPGVDKLTKDSPAPVQPDAKGIYPQPEPGIKKREY
jgi:predicted dehydrogenase